jgi:NAD-dependent dihydropyrimidine dehydrogenase PreA subunit
MASDVYRRLAQHLDSLPAGYPSTDSGVELRILRRLFSEAEAELAMHLTLLGDPPRVVAHRAGIPVDEAAERLAEMERKGLVWASHPEGGPPRYTATQFVIGIYEFQAGRLTPELAADIDEYLPTLLNADHWTRAPQLRTIPIGESIETVAQVLPYERAEALVDEHDRFAVAPCLCREEQRLNGAGCDKPLETCLIFGDTADFYLRNGLAREIDRDEVMAILERADEAGLVLQPNNARSSSNICACCGCCCGVLKTVKRYPKPAEILSSPFRAVLDPDACVGCGVCIGRCQMAAITQPDEVVSLNLDRCIGCGLCVTTCPTGALKLERKPPEEQPHVPRTSVETHIRVARARGLLRPPEMIKMLLKGAVDRLRARG